MRFFGGGFMRRDVGEAGIISHCCLGGTIDTLKRSHLAFFFLHARLRLNISLIKVRIISAV